MPPHLDQRRHDLLEKLALFVPTGELEAQHRERMQLLLTALGDVFSRRHFEPGHFTASTFVLSPDLRSILLIFHGKLHRWLQPGGHVDAEDPDIEAAARREVQEEVGLPDLQNLPQWPSIFDVDVHEIPALRGEPAHAHFDVRFVFAAPSMDFLVGSDAHAAKWVALGDVAGLESDASVLRAVAKLTRALHL